MVIRWTKTISTGSTRLSVSLIPQCDAKIIFIFLDLTKKKHNIFFASGEVMGLTWDRTYPRGLSLSDYHALGEELGLSLSTDQDFERFDDEIMKWSEETFEANKEKISKKKQYGTDKGKEQDLDQNQGET